MKKLSLLGTAVITISALFLVFQMAPDANGEQYLEKKPLLKDKSENVYIVFLNGLGSSCDGTRYNNMHFYELRKILAGVGFSYYDERFIMYSYNGGIVKNGRWFPEKHTPRDTGQPIQLSASRLEYLIEQISLVHPEARFILVGHSLGGRIALDFASTAGPVLRKKIIGIVTLNSPLLGSSKKIPGVVMNLLNSLDSILSSPAVRQLLWECSYSSKLQVMRRYDIKKLKKEGISVATFSTREDKVVEAINGCIMDQNGQPMTEGFIVRANDFSIRDLTSHINILNNKKVHEYLINLYLDVILRG
ncbi:MAG: hypothetical protein H0Z40_03730 [Desulfotomaculum sp.]|nr:hypothetical protein [Desulfotomaculum sp.]